MPLIAFRLSMPSNNAWNGKWSGEGKSYVVVKILPKKQSERIVAGGHYSHRFGDGWVAAVKATQVDVKTANKLRKNSAGFCGYNWMIDDIITYGEIRE